MSGEKSTGREVLENGLKNISSFLKTRTLPGKAKLNRRDAPDGAAQEQQTQHPADKHGAAHPALQDSQHKSSQSASTNSEVLAGAVNLDSQYEIIEKGMDLLGVRGGDETSTSGAETQEPSQPRAASSHRVKKFHKILCEPVVDLDALRELSWNGIPSDLRPLCWRLLLGYLPPNRSRQAQALARKRHEYLDMVPEFYDISNCERSEDEVGALRQVSVDVPRTAPNVPFFQLPAIQKTLERLLYIWGIRHPASGYVQGMNDLVTPFLAVFLSEHLPGSMDTWSEDNLTETVLLEVEADCYWCLCKLLEGIQDHYTYAQPGIQRTVFKLKELISRCHEPIAKHLDAENIDFLQFAFRWVNCLLIREVPFPAAIRLWDTYLAEGTHFSEFLVYICAAFLMGWASQLTQLEFQDLMLFLQKLPTAGWTEAEMETVLSKAYVLKQQWTQGHLNSQPLDPTSIVGAAPRPPR
eukprot:jgi/Chrzof1/7409/Cz02g22070.t1